VFADSLAAVIDHFLDHVRPRIRGEVMLGIEILQPRVDHLQITRPHVLGRVYSEIEDRWDLEDFRVIIHGTLAHAISSICNIIGIYFQPDTAGR